MKIKFAIAPGKNNKRILLIQLKNSDAWYNISGEAYQKKGLEIEETFEVSFSLLLWRLSDHARDLDKD